MAKYKSGVLFGEELEALYQDAKNNEFAIPAVNITGTDTINASLEAAAKVNSPIIIQFSNGGAQFIAGKGMPNDKLQANIFGGVSGALHIHTCCKILWSSGDCAYGSCCKKMVALDQRSP